MPSHYKGKTGAEREEALREHQEQTGEGMPYTPFKMKGFSGFGNSPAQHKYLPHTGRHTGELGGLSKDQKKHNASKHPHDEAPTKQRGSGDFSLGKYVKKGVEKVQTGEEYDEVYGKKKYRRKWENYDYGKEGTGEEMKKDLKEIRAIKEHFADPFVKARRAAKKKSSTYEKDKKPGESRWDYHSRTRPREK